MFLLLFLRTYIVILLSLWPLISLMILLIVLLGWRVARIEGWSFSLGMYCAFITATTVGYGVVHPTKSKSRLVCVFIAIIGLILTGILVALAIESLTYAADQTQLNERISRIFPAGNN